MVAIVGLDRDGVKRGVGDAWDGAYGSWEDGASPASN